MTHHSGNTQHNRWIYKPTFSYTECPALNGSKIKHYVSSTMKCIGEINTFSNIGPHKVMRSVDISMAAQHVSRWCSVSCQALASISVVTRFMQLWWFCHITHSLFPFFHDSAFMSHQN